MGEEVPKIVDKSAMREHIMNAAMQTYREQGFHATKMTDIADAACMAKGTLYLYFKNKEELTNRLVRWIFQQLEQEIKQQSEVQTLTDYMAQLETMLDTPEDARLNTRMFFEVLRPSFDSPDVVAEVAAFFERVAAANTLQLAQLIKSGEVNRDVDTVAMGRSIAAMIDGLVTHRALFGVTDAKYHQMMDATLMLVQRGLQP